MKALLLGPAHPLRGGIANFNESLAIAFIKNSIETEIVSFYYQYPSFLFPGKTQKAEGKPPYSLKIKSLISSVNPWSWIRTAHFITHERPDIIVVQHWIPFMGPAIGTILRLISKKHSPKIIAIVHNAKPHENRFGDFAFTKYFTRACHGFVCLSKSVLNDLSLFTPNKNKVFVPHPVYDIFGDKISKKEARKHLSLPENEKIILFFGIIRKYKGLELLLNTMGLEKIKKQNIKLLVAGEVYEGKQDYQNQIELLGLKDNVILMDKFIPTDQVKYYFCASDLIVQPYITATQSGVTQIAYNFERPMLVTNVGGLAEIVLDKHTGYVTEVEAQSIADAICDFYDNDREEKMSENVALESYRFTWHAMVDAILQLSESLYQPKPTEINNTL